MGFHSTVMGTIIHISKDGFSQEEIPYEFLARWKCQGPYKKIDELGFLDPPSWLSEDSYQREHGIPSEAYRSGKRSPYIEWLLDFIHQYPPMLSDREEMLPLYKLNPVEQFLYERNIH